MPIDNVNDKLFNQVAELVSLYRKYIIGLTQTQGNPNGVAHRGKLQRVGF